MFLPRALRSRGRRRAQALNHGGRAAPDPYSFATDRLRATGHTASDQVETVLYRIVTSGVPGGIERRREDGVVRPLLDVRREETEAYCDAAGLPVLPPR